jgi:xylulokinase
MYLLGYDIGSSKIKAALFYADKQELVGLVQYPGQDMDILSRQSGWAEQQPLVWWQDLCYATQKLLSEFDIDPHDIQGIGIGYQMHGLVLIDKENQVLRPAIIWCDSRAVSIGEQAFHDIGTDYCLEYYLNSPGNFTASRLKWVKDNEPDTYNKIDKILLPGDFIAMKLTGEPVTTIPGLTEGIFWNFRERKIAHELLNYYELDESLIAETIPTFSFQGKVTRRAAEMTGLAPGIPVTYRAGDQPNNALSVNVLKPGEVAATSGTSGVVYGIVDSLKYDPNSRVNAFAHVNYEEDYDRIGILSCLNGAGIQYSWMKHQVARSTSSYADMERMVSSVPVGSDGLCILPFGNGAERIFNNKNINSHITNLQFNRHTRGHLYRAALEGVAFAFVYGINILKEIGLNVDLIRVGNDNLFQSKTFSMTIATLLGSHIEVVDTTGAIGAARAAGVASGAYSSLEEALEGITPTIVYEPSLKLALCKQAYNYWISSLDRMIEEGPHSDRSFKIVKSENKYLKEELKNKEEQLSKTSLKLLSKEEALKETLNTMNLLAQSDNPYSIQDDLKRLTHKLKQSIESDEGWATFEEHYDLVHNNFFRKLKNRFPQMTIPDFKLSAYLKMKLSTKEIADRLNLSIRGTETRRYRLRKKLGLKKDDSLTKFLDHL